MPIGIAIGGAALIGAGASIYAGSKASKAQQQGANAAIAEDRRQYDQTRTDFAPWRTTGASALAKLAGMYGIGDAPGTTATPGTMTGTGDYGGFFTSPGYQFRRDQGVQAVERSAASRGLLRSGAATKAIARYTDGLASSEYQAFGDRLAQIAGFGQSATGSTAAAGDASASRIGAANIAAGNARASSYANIGSSVNSGINNVLSAYLYQSGGGFGK